MQRKVQVRRVLRHMNGADLSKGKHDEPTRPSHPARAVCGESRTHGSTGRGEPQGHPLTLLTQPTTTAGIHHVSARATLAALGLKLRSLDLFGPIGTTVTIPQKTVKHSPTQKLYDAFSTLLADAQGLVEITTRLRSDPALQRAFGRTSCAEQSVVQETLDHCTAENGPHLEQGVATILRRSGQAAWHSCAQAWLLLDGDMSGMPCGPKAACAPKRDFAGYPLGVRHRRGRQLGRIIATDYDDIIVDRLFPGTTQFHAALPELVLAAEGALELDESKRRRTILRLDGGGGVGRT